MTPPKMNDRKKVLIAVPCYRYCEPETMKSIYGLIIPDDCEVNLEFVTGYTVAQARNRCVAVSLSGGYDYTLFVDGDVILPRELLSELLKTGAPIATGWYIKKIPGGDKITELYAPTSDGKESMANILEKDLPEQPALVSLTGCGFGCTLVRNEVFKAIGKDCWFEYIERPGGIVCSEDLAFCIKARNLRFDIVAHSGLRCGHIGHYVY